MAGYTAHVVFDPAARVGVILLRDHDQGRTELQRASTELLLALVRAGVPAGVPAGVQAGVQVGVQVGTR